MKVQIISFHCVLKNKFGKILSSSINHDVLTGPSHSSDQPELIALSRGLMNLTPGEKRSISLSAAEAYGFYDPKKVLTMPVGSFTQFENAKFVEAPVVLDVDGKPHSFRVIDLNHEIVTLDGNHPFAGQDLIFEIETIAARDATDEEISESRSENNPLYH
ncbi:MAG: peptidylprolyl isomerase [Bdellovibrio sp.]|nr:peptidylprolyl isomerase [Bdellovibrio sp.]